MPEATARQTLRTTLASLGYTRVSETRQAKDGSYSELWITPIRADGSSDMVMLVWSGHE